MKLKLSIPALFAAIPAHAHEMPVAHAHPHADWAMTAFAVLAAGVIVALVVSKMRSDRHRDAD